MATTTGTLHEEQHTFSILSLSILLTIKNFSDKFTEETKTHILCSIIPPPPQKKSCHLCDNVEK
jgi:hypothetical protein